MRRKSERNKTKSSPEKKPEKPTRKSTRRRTKKSPSTSPDRETSNDVDGPTLDKESTSNKVQTSGEGKDISETIIEEAETKVTSTEGVVTDCVWKVSRQDASPGEIQKLKLCRQRNLSETSSEASMSMSRKRLNRLQEGSESGSIAEEADSADERIVKVATPDIVDDTSSTITKSEITGEEVSHRVENPPQQQTYDLSDVKHNVDCQDGGGTSSCQDDGGKLDRVARDSVDNPAADVKLQEDAHVMPTGPAAEKDNIEEPNGKNRKKTMELEEKAANVERKVLEKEDKPDRRQEKFEAKQKEAEKESECEEKQEKSEEIEDTSSKTAETASKFQVKSKMEDNASKHQETSEVIDKSDEKLTNDCKSEKTDGKWEKNVDKSHKVIEQSEKVEEKIEKLEADEKLQRKIDEKSERTMTDEKCGKLPDNREEKSDDKESQSKSEESVKSDDEKSCKESKSHDSSSSSDENSRKSLRSSRSSRRKHRDKYRDSSNSDSGESEEESRRRRRGKRDEEETKKEAAEKSEKEGKVKEDEEKEKISEITSVKEEKFVESEKTEADKTQGSNNASRPAKVNLKRVFTSRILTDESKKDDADIVNDATLDKENYGTDETKILPKRRRWGTALSTDTAPILSISTDSLKVLVPGAKPLALSEIRLTKDDEDRERRKEKKNPSIEKEKTKDETKSNNDISKDNHLGTRRKILIVKDTPQLKSPSPPQAQPTSILLIRNLVRPFTLNQIKELLSRTGTIVENGFWMDRIKSKCFVEYSNEDQAFETRQALHGISWPVSNPKKLLVEYSTKEEMEKAKESSKDQPLLRKVETSGVDVWQHDWGRDEKTNATTKVTVVREWDLGKEDGQHLMPKDKDKDKKDLDKKRRQRSRSPTLEAHLPAPARKFKKKEDEPPPAKLLDDLFRKTKATPCIYWLPLTNEQIVVKEEMRRQHMAEHARRLEEMRRAERNRDSRRRRSPRK